MAPRKIFHDSVAPLPAPDPERVYDGTPIAEATAAHGEETMPLLFSLALPPDVTAQLEERVARGQVVSRDELHTRFAVPREQADRVAGWLQAQGFEITGISEDGTGVYARARVSQIEQSLDVKMVPVTRHGRTYIAAQNPPSLPADVGEPVHAIVGLQPYRRPHKHGVRHVSAQGSTPAGVEGSAPPAAGAPQQKGYLVRDILAAYNANSLGVTGAGQTIAILIDTVPQPSDVQAFWEQNGIPVEPGRIVKVGQGKDPATESEEEASLDVQWSSGIAPGAKIRVYTPGSLNMADVIGALDQILADLPSQPAMRQLSISFGLGETYALEAPGEVQAKHQRFLKLAAAGVNVFVSSGDAGSNPDWTGRPGGALQVEYASSDPMVVAVGGTRLTLSPDGTVLEETAWAGSGGGVSIVFDRPAWQGGLDQPGTKRLVPDVSLAADPGRGAFLVFQGNPVMIGGTSWSAPVWAGFCALMNEARMSVGHPALPFLNPLLYPLKGTSAFRDIQQGSNGEYQAGPGYDLITGLGVPNVANLLQALP